MKAETASQLLSLSIQNRDLDAMHLACSYAPWKDGPLGFDPLTEIASDLKDARNSKHRKIEEARKSWRFFLQALAQSGYSSSMKGKMTGLVELGYADVPSLVLFAKETLAFARERGKSCFLLHDLMESSRANSKWIVNLVEAGFDPHQERKGGLTPLHLLVKAAISHSPVDRLDTIKLLIDRGWDMSRKSSLGQSPADLSASASWDAVLGEKRWLYAPVLAKLQALLIEEQVEHASRVDRPRVRL